MTEQHKIHFYIIKKEYLLSVLTHVTHPTFSSGKYAWHPLSSLITSSAFKTEWQTLGARWNLNDDFDVSYRGFRNLIPRGIIASHNDDSLVWVIKSLTVDKPEVIAVASHFCDFSTRSCDWSFLLMKCVNQKYKNSDYVTPQVQTILLSRPFGPRRTPLGRFGRGGRDYRGTGLSVKLPVDSLIWH